MNAFSKNYPDHQVGRKWLIDLLKTQPVTVVFEKSNGEHREMNCTLEESIVVPYVKKTDKEKKHDPEVLPVWDIDKNAWRSFRYDSIIKINFDVKDNSNA